MAWTNHRTKISRAKDIDKERSRLLVRCAEPGTLYNGRKNADHFQYYHRDREENPICFNKEVKIKRTTVCT